MKENLCLLTCLQYLCFSAKAYGLLIKFFNLERLVKAHYTSTSNARARVLEHLLELPLGEKAKFEELVKKEYAELTETHSTFEKVCWQFLKKVSFGAKSCEEFIRGFERDALNMASVKTYRRRYSAWVRDRKPVNELAILVNGGEPLSQNEEQLVRTLGRVSTYKFNAKEGTICYHAYLKELIMTKKQENRKKSVRARLLRTSLSNK